MRYLFILPFIAFFSFKVQAEILSCTQMWCQEGLMLNLKGDQWPAGEYMFKIKLDDKDVTCKGSLPFKTCDGSVTCDDASVTIGESGCAMENETHSFHAVMVQTPPKHMTLDIARGDGKSFSFDSAVESQCGYPNGEQCDLRPCCSAMLETEVVWK